MVDFREKMRYRHEGYNYPIDVERPAMAALNAAKAPLVDLVAGAEGPELIGRQVMARDLALTGRSMFITGPGGVGKTVVVRAIVEALRNKGKRVAISASTGIAAVAIGGMTIHSTLKTGIAGNRAEMQMKMGPESVAKAAETLYRIDTLLVDEVSMLTGDYIDMMNWWLGLVREQPLVPFGGLQVIFIGDFLQLPPVITEMDHPKVSKVYAFESDSWKAGDIEEVYLNQSHRQADPEMFKHLCRIRRGLVEPDTIEYFRPALGRVLEDPTKLYPTNAEVLDENTKQLARLPGEPEVFNATFEGHPKWCNALADNCIADEVTRLKVGAPVIFLQNQPGQFVNGERGTVRGFEDGWPVVEKEDGREVVALPGSWEMRDSQNKVLAKLTQVPVKLAWAVSIHKSQGMSLSRVQIDLGNCFERGQAYVALSRARSLDGLSLSVLPSVANVRASGKVVRYYQELAARMRAKESPRG